MYLHYDKRQAETLLQARAAVKLFRAIEQSKSRHAVRPDVVHPENM